MALRHFERQVSNAPAAALQAERRYSRAPTGANTMMIAEYQASDSQMYVLVGPPSTRARMAEAV